LSGESSGSGLRDVAGVLGSKNNADTKGPALPAKRFQPRLIGYAVCLVERHRRSPQGAVLACA
jgi:hypothetical protein